MSEQRALLLTDVVDSTQLAERLGDAAAAELGAAHDRVARDLLRAWRGREIDKTDGMLMLFDHATDALGFAMAYHVALAELPVALKARAGLHVGAVILRANPPEDVAHGAKPLEVEGIAKPVAARVMSLALGGQTLLTPQAKAALGATSLRVQSHGYWRIKGIAEPVELFEAGDERAPFEPPPDSAKVYRVVQRDGLWMPVREVPRNLPAERDGFVGRELVLGQLAQRLDAGARLISVLGIGGTGKTRLVTRFAWHWLGDFPGGAWFCDLSAARGVDGIAHAVALGLDVPLGLDDPIVQLGHAIAGRGRCLIILDNFEQVARHAAATLGRWLDRAAEARFLVTTREVLGLPGEEALALAPLDAAEAESLFHRRAASAMHDYAPDADDREAIPRLVQLLDGLPLAIELAAARVRVMPPQILLSRMGERFKLLVAAGGRQDRQATLRAAFDWSWDLLTEAEKSAMAQLSVFEGGFTLPAAEAVIDLSDCKAAVSAADVLHSLVDKSFVRPSSRARFDLLSSVQEYAAEHLRTPYRYPGSGPEALHGAHRRHASHFAALHDRLANGGAGPEVDNLMAACRRSTLQGNVANALATLEAAWATLKLRGPFAPVVELSKEVGERLQLDRASQARVDLVVGSALSLTGNVEAARVRLEAGLALAREVGLDQAEAQILISLGALHTSQGRSGDARRCYEAALSMALASAKPSLECEALNGLGSTCIDEGKLDEARQHYVRALVVARAAADTRLESALLGNLGGLDFYEGQLDEAGRLFEAGLVLARQLGNRVLEGNALCNLGALRQTQARHDQARDDSEAALRVGRSIGHVRLECTALCNLGLAMSALGDFPAAQFHYADALKLCRELGDRRSEGLFLGYLGQLQIQLGRLEEAAASLCAGLRLMEPFGDALGMALLKCHQAELALRCGQPDSAQRMLGEVRQTAAELGSGPSSELGLSLARVGRLAAEAMVATPGHRPEGPTGS